jgi:plasmid stabilization system protein ParE
VIWAPLAIERAASAAQYIAQDRPAAAAKWIDELIALAKGLGSHPQRGRVVPQLDRPDLREILHGQYRVVYRVDAKRIVILTVRHTVRLFDAAELEG